MSYLEDNFIAGYLFDEGIDEPVVLVTDYNGDKELDVLSLVRDRQNSVKLIVNEKKEIVQEVSYSAYGETKIMNRGQKNPNLNNIFYYTSRELEPELGIYYYRARYYDPSVGRFLSEDPIGFEGLDTNLYRYTLNNPTTRQDPSGLYSSSGNTCEIEALEDYFKNQDFGQDYCEKELDKAMAICDLKKKKNENKELDPKEKALEKAILKKRLDDHKKEGEKNLKKMRDDILKGRK